MRKIPLFILVLIIFSSFSVSSENKIDPSNDPVAKVAMPLDKIASMKTREAEKILGRKLTLKEKIAFKIAQHKIKKELRAKEKGKPSKGQSAFVLGLIGICILFVPYLSIAALPLAIIAIVQGSKAKKEDPNDKKAQTAIVLGIVTLGLIALALILVLLIIAAWSGAWY
jgi:hypothetical protein